MTWDINADTSTNKDLFKGILKKLFDNTIREAVFQAPRMFKMETTEDEYERDARMAGLSGHTQIEDGEEIPLQTPVFDDTKDYEQERYATGFKITEGMKKFNKYDLMKKFTRSLAKAMKEAKDKELAKLWNNMAATTYASGFDGYALAYATHDTLSEDGDTFSNYGDADMSLSAMEDAMTYFATHIDDMGDTHPLTPTDLFFAPQLQFTAREIFGSDLKPGEMSNTTNALADLYNIKPFRYDRLTSSTAWGVICKDEEFDVKCYTSAEPDIVVMDSPDTSRSTIVTSRQYFDYGFGAADRVYVGNT